MEYTTNRQAGATSLRLISVMLAAAGLIGMSMPAAAANISDATAQREGQDRSAVIVELNGDALANYVRTKPARGKKIDFNNQNVKSYRAQLAAARNDFKQWLRANVPNAKVTGEFDISLNAVAVQLNGATLEQVAAAPMAARTRYQNVFYPLAADPDLAVIRATDAWAQSGGPATAGAGVRVAIIDSGIDLTHPCFSDAGYAAQSQIGDRRFTNNKVIAAKVFNNRAGSNAYTPQAIDSHGTHVSGTVACNFETPVTVDGVAIPYKMSGVAPRALLGNYNVFPGHVANARSEDIFNAMEAAYQDGFDVINMSLGGGYHGNLDLEMQAVNNLDQANMVVAIAAGNSGPGYGTVESPGAAERALTAGASSVGHKIVTLVTVGGQTFQSVKGEFGSVPPGGLTAPLNVVTDASSPYGGLSTLCAPVGANSLSGSIALISRGVCDFTVKIRNAQAAGAVGALVVNREAGDPSVMGTNDDASQPTIPAYMVGLSDRAALMARNGSPATISATGTYVFSADGNDVLAGFSSWGPTAVSYRAKPDVMAPGANVLSSVPASSCAAPPCFAFFNGTSMATPHLAGSAAVLVGQHPDWSSSDVRSAVVNTAVRGVVKTATGGMVNDVNVVGAGREDLSRATQAAVTLDPVSVSFGPVPSGSGQARSIDVNLRNVSNAFRTLNLSTSGGDASVKFSVDQSSVTLAPGASATVRVSMDAVQGAAPGNHQGFLEVNAGGAEVAHAVLFSLIK
ncbi:S8 family serine peptidase [Noviherbaspirillum galbum]|uniref:S8 family serine peptidase n=1 Tax=Noviherbaspirillum galbum TaxID=2709383 RepID=A0A6B3SGS7_9BURK|nr:S8 family serine peptidase [Noviherbaspirillum galbum]NEX59878.1 S8 family serine peptidase [Noviherbaspirillum galbum]